MKKNITDSDAFQRYEAVKQRIGFVWWSLKKKEDRLYVILDGLDLDLKIKGKIILWNYDIYIISSNKKIPVFS